MKKVVSIALFGAGDAYTQYLRSFVRAHLNLFPLDENWKLRVHVDQDMHTSRTGELLSSFEKDGLVDVCLMPAQPLCRAMLWRMAPVFHDDVDYVFCRDIDACPLPRDRAVCEQFMQSNCHVGTAHDHSYHVGIMGGLCHFWSKPFREVMRINNLTELYAAANFTDAQWAVKGADQIALNRLILSNPNIHFLEHRFSGWTEARPGTKGRMAGSYGCQAWSTPVPDCGKSPFADELVVKAESLANHLGAAGYDHEAAMRFYDEHGDQDIAKRVRACEERT